MRIFSLKLVVADVVGSDRIIKFLCNVSFPFDLLSAKRQAEDGVTCAQRMNIVFGFSVIDEAENVITRIHCTVLDKSRTTCIYTLLRLSY